MITAKFSIYNGVAICEQSVSGRRVLSVKSAEIRLLKWLSVIRPSAENDEHRRCVVHIRFLTPNQPPASRYTVPLAPSEFGPLPTASPHRAADPLHGGCLPPSSPRCRCLTRSARNPAVAALDGEQADSGSSCNYSSFRQRHHAISRVGRFANPYDGPISETRPLERRERKTP